MAIAGLLHDFTLVLAVEGWTIRDEHIRHHTDGPDISLHVALTFEYLGSEVVRRAHTVVQAFFLIFKRRRLAQVNEPNTVVQPTCFIDQHEALELDVAVHNVVAMTE